MKYFIALLVTVGFTNLPISVASGGIMGRRQIPQLLIQSPQTDINDFAIAKKVNKQQSLADHFAKSIYKHNPTRKLKKIFGSAQELYLQGKNQDAKRKWLDVVQLSLKHHWSLDDRATISSSYFRLAQLENEPQNSDKWLRRAYDFDPKYIPQKNIFPPSIIDRFELLQTENIPMVVDLKNFTEYRYIVVNGQIFDLFQKKSIRWPDAIVRVTWVSSVFPLHTQTLPVSKLGRVKLEHPPLVTGSCQKPEINLMLLTQSITEKVIPVYPGPCFPKSETKAQIDNSSFEFTKYDKNLWGTLDRPGHWEKPIHKRKKFLKNPWIWAGVGLIAGAIMINQSRNEEKSSPRPTTHEEGF